MLAVRFTLDQDHAGDTVLVSAPLYGALYYFDDDSVIHACGVHGQPKRPAAVLSLSGPAANTTAATA